MNYEDTLGIPVYQAVDCIEETMESPLNQSFNSKDYLIVDYCINDGATEVEECLKREYLVWRLSSLWQILYKRYKYLHNLFFLY